MRVHVAGIGFCRFLQVQAGFVVRPIAGHTDLSWIDSPGVLGGQGPSAGFLDEPSLHEPYCKIGDALGLLMRCSDRAGLVGIERRDGGGNSGIVLLIAWLPETFE